MDPTKVLERMTVALDRQNEIWESILADKGIKAKKQAAQHTGQILFGGGGTFATPGLEPDVITAHVRPQGLISELPWLPSVMEQPHYGTITGFTGTTGSEPVNPCDDAPSGYMKGCNLTAAFGRVQRDTNTIEWDKILTQLHRGITTELSLRGRLLGLDNVDPGGLSEADALNIVTMAEMIGVGVQLERVLTQMFWQGTPANNTANGGYKEFPGLDRQIATGQVDAESGNPCIALDSDVKDFTYHSVAGVSPSIVNYMSMLEFYLRFNARRMGLEPVEWIWVMRPELFFELTAVWPCQYNTNRCASAVIGANSTVFLDGRENVRERDRMRESKTIDVNGRTYRVVEDDGIFEHNNINNPNLAPGQYASSIYFIPLRITGNFPVTYMEHVDYRQGARDLALLRGNEQFWTDRGMYSWAVEIVKWCYKLSAKIEPRVILRTPQLAGRIDAVMYEPLQHLRSPYADDPYFADGGVSTRGTPDVHAVWM